MQQMHFGIFPVTSPVPHSACLAEVSNRKRVGKACDACRIKKSICDGSRPCSRCVAEDKICVFTDRKRSTDKLYSGPYVELLESRIKMLRQGIELLVQRINRGDSITSLLKDDEGKININKVLDNLFVQCTTDALAGIKRASTVALSDCDESDDVEGTELERDHATKRRHAYPTSIGSLYSAFSEVPSLVSSPAIAPSFSSSPSPELTHLSSLSFSLSPYSLDLTSPLHNFDCLDKVSGTSIDVWSASRLLESSFC
ncbi:hypothetical protein V1515DRAFT_612937 [Lipomyces mesembrius]